MNTFTERDTQQEESRDDEKEIHKRSQYQEDAPLHVFSVLS